MFSELVYPSVNNIFDDRGFYCAAVSSSTDDVEISAIFLKNGKIVNCSDALWFYNSFIMNNKPYPFLCHIMGKVVGFHFNGIYTCDNNDSPENAIISSLLNQMGVNKGVCIFLVKDWHQYIDADEVTFIVCSKNRFHSSNIKGRFLDYDNGEVLSDYFISDIYPNAVSIQMFSLFSNNLVKSIFRASHLALLQDYVKAVS